MDFLQIVQVLTMISALISAILLISGNSLPLFTSRYRIVKFIVKPEVLGSENIFGYNYSLQPNSNGIYDSKAIIPGAKRFWFLGVFISLDVKQN